MILLIVCSAVPQAMSPRNMATVALLGLIAAAGGLWPGASAQEPAYTMADGLGATLTFTFIDGVETHDFPVFRMGENMVDNGGITFTVQGILGNAPHLYEALDQAYAHRLQYTGGSSFMYDYRYFQVDVDFVRDGGIVKGLGYHDCSISNYGVKTLRDDQESYLSSKTGFAIIDEIDFECSGLNGVGSPDSRPWSFERMNSEFESPDYGFADGVRTFVTLEFASGTERIEFPYFETLSGLSEGRDKTARFLVEGVVADYPLLYGAIEKSRKVSGVAGMYNDYFDAKAEFVRDGRTIRALGYSDCTVDSALITTLSDKEDGFTGKGGFAVVNRIGFACSGLVPANPAMDPQLEGGDGAPEPHGFPVAGDIRAVATFSFRDGQEVVDYPVYAQSSPLTKSGHAFTLAGIVSETPMLYGLIDSNLKIRGHSGASPALELFDVTVDVHAGGEHVRAFNYSDCRVTDYAIKSARDKEDGYFKGFALENTFDFECLGFQPGNPMHDMMSKLPKAENITTNDLRETHSWGRGFVP